MSEIPFSIEGEGDETNIFGTASIPMAEQKTAVVLGGGGFIGSHLVHDLKRQGFFVIAADLKFPEFSSSGADQFHKVDLRNPVNVAACIPESADEVYQLAADMGGAGFIFTGENDADVMHNSALVNLNVVHECARKKVKKVFFSSSACIYPGENQIDPLNPMCEESSAFPANPDSAYGWEKLFSEILYQSFAKNYGLDIRIARFHNIFGPEGTFIGGREKAPAALCRKVAEAEEGGWIEVWGSGQQTRSFLFITECIAGIRKIMDSKSQAPVNLGSEEMIAINDLAKMIIGISGKDVKILNVPGPIGVNGRNSDNRLLNEKTGWVPSQPLFVGIKETYFWIQKIVSKA